MARKYFCRERKLVRHRPNFGMLGVFAVLVVVMLSLFMVPNFVPDSTHADDDFPPPISDPSISIAPAGGINLVMTPNVGSGGSFGTAIANVTVNTSNPTGYTFTMNTETTNTDLKNNKIDYTQSGMPDFKITNLTASTTTSNFPLNKWGYNVSKAGTYIKGAANTFIPVPNSSSSDADRQIEVTNTNGSNTYSFAYAAKADLNLPSGDYSTTIVFSATANPFPTMQEFDYAACIALTTDQTITLYDERDNTPYTVAKLQDGNCWMTQNLELGEYGTPMNLTNTLSNVSSSGYTLNFSYANNSTYKGNSNKYGNFYNWSQATAGSGATTAGQDAQYDICPKGWRLPSTTTSYTTDNEFYTMLNDYITTGTWSSTYWDSTTPSEWTSQPVSLVYSGYMYSNGSLSYQGGRGYWWSATSNGSSDAFDLDTYANGNVFPRVSYGTSNSFSVRCIVRRPPPLYETVASMSKGTQTVADLQTTITTSNSGVYEYNSSVFGTSSDASNDHTIYYYRGILDSDLDGTSSTYGSNGDGVTWPNYVKLGNTCWRIVRTTGSGGVKMIYNGLYSSGTTANSCANRTTNAQVISQAFGLQGNSASPSSWHYNINRVGYTFNNTQNLQDSTTATSVDTVFGSNTNPALNNARSNIKTYIEDTWYANNMTSYTSILEASAGYCNDRTAYSDNTTAIALSTIPPYRTSSSGQTMYFGAYGRNANATSAGKPPSLTCPRSTVDLYHYVANSEGVPNELKYPVALLTADEVSFAGSGRSTATQGSSFHVNSYLRSGSNFWLLSPGSRSSSGVAFGFCLYSYGSLNDYNVFNSYGVRPAISLKSGVAPASGSGTATDPWVVNP